MLTYIIEEPSLEADEKRMYKYPFVVSEAFKTEASCLMDPFFTTFDSTVKDTSIVISEVISEEARGSELIEDGKELKQEFENEQHKETLEEESIERIKGSRFSDVGMLDLSEQKDDICIMDIEEPQKEKSLPFGLAQDCDSVILSTPHNEEELKHENKYAMLEKLLSFIQDDSELNPVLAGYFGNVVEALVSSKRAETLTYLLNDNEHMQGLLKHSYNTSIATLLAKLLKTEDSAKDELLEKKQIFIEIMVASIVDGDLPPETTKSCYRILTDLALQGNMLEYLTSEPIICRICAQTINGNEELASEALGYLSSIFKYKGDALNNDVPSFVFSSISLQATPEEETKQIDYKSIASHCINYLEPLKQKLETKPTKYLPTQFNEQVPICSQLKLSIIELIHSLVRLKDSNIAKELKEFPKVLLDLVKIHYMNSCLHSRVYQIFNDVLTSKVETLIETV